MCHHARIRTELRALEAAAKQAAEDAKIVGLCCVGSSLCLLSILFSWATALETFR